ncbi:hypothetical protein Pmani_036888 [Petrolisthes manimaculis]|uniref:Uncharacterized protein n=1 Tax=Petrolisthes manimaculis TaxID=1843537 RepID=A0AAE1NIM3_9EUCA|nr:hypothetical protein Pmani_036888 [Petrolisthes manimaculis]
MYKLSLEAVWPQDQPGPALSFSLHTGKLHVEGGGLTTDGVSECYSGLQVRCPGAERCVSPYWICDGAPDCPDGADEVGCEDTPCSGFHCYDDACIASAWRCDGHRDCKNGDDEFACPDCMGGDIMCPQGGGCIAANATCDGIINCPDGWDEAGNLCGSIGSCGQWELRCLEGGRCVPHHQLCDGTPDCPAAEDEDSTFCSAFTSVVNLNKKPPVRKEEEEEAEEEEAVAVAVVAVEVAPCKAERNNCTEEQFECESGECIHEAYLCNGIRDCSEGEDEMPHRCTFMSTAAPTTQKPRRYDSEEDEYESEEDYLDTTDLEYASEHQESDPWCGEDDVHCDNDNESSEILQMFTEGPEGVTLATTLSNTNPTLDTPTDATPTEVSISDRDQYSDTGTSLEAGGLQTTESPSVPTTARSEEVPVVTTDGSTESTQGLEEEEDHVNDFDHTNTIDLEDVDISVEVIVEDSLYPDYVEQDFNLSSSEEQTDQHPIYPSTSTHIHPATHTSTISPQLHSTTSTSPHLVPIHTGTPDLQNTTHPTSSNQDHDTNEQRYTDTQPLGPPVSKETVDDDFYNSFLDEHNESDERTPTPSGNTSLHVSTARPGQTEVEGEGDDESYDVQTSDEEFTPVEDDDDDDDETRRTTDHSVITNTVSPPSTTLQTSDTNSTTINTPSHHNTSSTSYKTVTTTTTTTLPQSKITVLPTSRDISVVGEITESSIVTEGPQTHSLPYDNPRVPHNDADGGRPVTSTIYSTGQNSPFTSTPLPATSSLPHMPEDTEEDATEATRVLIEDTDSATPAVDTTEATGVIIKDTDIATPKPAVDTTETTRLPTVSTTGISTHDPIETRKPPQQQSTTTSEAPEVVEQNTGSTSLPTTNIKIASSMPTIITADPEDWKDMPMGQNLTILIAVHSELNESNRIPQYVIHGMDGSTYNYEVVSIVKEQLDEEKKKEEAERETVMGSDGTHQYLQGNEMSSASTTTSPFIVVFPSIFMVVLVQMVIRSGCNV